MVSLSPAATATTVLAYESLAVHCADAKAHTATTESRVEGTLDAWNTWLLKPGAIAVWAVWHRSEV
jgi:hypothetical protein